MARRMAPPHGRRRCIRPSLVVLAVLAVWYYLLPYDNTVRLSVRFNSQRVVNTFAQPPSSFEAWLLAPSSSSSASSNQTASTSARRLPVLYDDVGVVLKTGFATQHRVAAQIDALGLRPDSTDAHNLIVVGDWDGSVAYGPDNRLRVPVADVIGPVLDNGILGAHANCARAEKYHALAAAVRSGNDGQAIKIAKAAGWELDAMKFIPGLELAYTKMPDKDWYLLLDDDTFVVPSSLRLLLAHLDPAMPYYIGNAVGDFRGRFAPGGSAVVLSRTALTLMLGSGMSRVRAGAAQLGGGGGSGSGGGHTPFVGATPLLYQAYVDATTATWGDKLLAATLMKVGVYLDERFARLFNGARPHATRISADRFCIPLVSFHGLAEPERMRNVGRVFAAVDAGQRGGIPDALAPAVAWGDLWALYGRPSVAALQRQPIHRGRDFVGHVSDDENDEAAFAATRVEDVASPEACRELCAGDEEGEVEDEVEDEAKGKAEGDGNDNGNSRAPLKKRFASLASHNNKCLAWTWNAAEQTCTTSAWFVVGEEAGVNEAAAQAQAQASPFGASTTTTSTRYSGVNVRRLRQLVGRCGRRDGIAWTVRDDAYALAFSG